MSNQQEQWVEEVLLSTKGKQLVLPPSDLFDKIAQQTTYPAPTVNWFRRPWVAAAAVALLCINGWALQQYQTNVTATNQLDMYSQQSLITDFNWYE